MRGQLPHFLKPPVVEVAVAAQFEPIPGFLAPHLGVVWERFRDRFPDLEQHPPAKTTIERAGTFAAKSGMTFELSQGVVTPRAWMKSEDGCDLVQIQSNRFVRNWRKYQTPEREYPRYENHIRPNFLSDFEVFRQCIADNSLADDIAVNQCEVTYLNHIVAEGWSEHSDLGRVFRGLKTNVDWSTNVESVAVQFVRTINSSDGEFLGRLHVDVRPGFTDLPRGSSSEMTPIFVASLVARGRPTTQDADGVIGFIDIGREEIVRTFDEITTPEMHAVWERQES